jgi:hypothetical protein
MGKSNFRCLLSFDPTRFIEVDTKTQVKSTLRVEVSFDHVLKMIDQYRTHRLIGIDRTNCTSMISIMKSGKWLGASVE